MRHVGLFAFAAVTLTSFGAFAADFTVAPTTSGGSFVWSINGQVNPPLSLVRGHTYTFSVNAPGHPFAIKTAPVTGTADEFNTGVTGQEATSDTLTFAVPSGQSTGLFYQCEVHSTMTGTIAFVDAPPAPWSGSTATVGLLALGLGAAGFMALRLKQRAAANGGPSAA